ncbi:MAG: aldehyde dehydrogenase family protein [Balneolaceae bacterium]|nr:MAG: aldehyde dehydrogenase family protein [Balneolaceae bacterium]
MSKSFQIISPVNGLVYAERKYANEETIESSLIDSAKAFTEWKNVPIERRTEICTRAVNYFKMNAEKWGFDLTMQMGRPIRYSPFEILNGFSERAGYMISIAKDTLSDYPVSEKNGFRRFIRKEPLGPVLVLAPWNYPYLTAVNSIIPAIMAGNPVILKHSDQTALCAEHFDEAFREAGLPDGVFRFLHLTHEQVARVLADERISSVIFTGSVQGGLAVQKAVSSRFIPVALELGGKDPAYVAEDADIDIAIENLVDGSFFNSGQSCCGIERIYVHHKMYDDFVEGFLKLTRSYVMGDPTKKETTLGPMARVSNAKTAWNAIEDAIRLGANAHIKPGDFPDLDFPWLAPQVLTEVNHNMNIMQEETFAPVACISSVGSDDEAVELMNDSKYGLTASIWTSDPEKALFLGNKIETGTLFMNRCDYLDPELAWTGVKQSGRGCTLSPMGYEQFTRPKSYHLKIATS